MLSLAAADFRAVARHTRDFRGPEQYSYLLWALAAILAVWLVLSWWDRKRQVPAAAPHSSEALFLELCRAHRLSAEEQALVRSVAARQGLNEPALAFVRPEAFRNPAGGDAAAVAQLAQRLFGAP
ncbi:MAG: hypothetical protein KY476_15755 [Planctomycetes bacterium]|nr:hypothetical protein [Planctomycetota bacterium]